MTSKDYSKLLSETWESSKRSDEEKSHILDDAIFYEVITALGVSKHDATDQASWEHLNFSRLGHARGLLDFFQQSKSERYRDDVSCEDFGFEAGPVGLAPEDEVRLNKDLFHLSYSRQRHRAKPSDKPWPVEILGPVHKRCADFVRHILSKQMPGTISIWNRRKWGQLLSILETERELTISYGPFDKNTGTAWRLGEGRNLASGLSELTIWARERYAFGNIQTQLATSNAAPPVITLYLEKKKRKT